MGRVLRRQPLVGEVIKSLGTGAAPEEWSPKRKGRVEPLLAEIATLAKASRLKHVSGTTEKDINSARNAKKGEPGLKPGLNLVGELDGDAAGETGFLDAGGRYRAGRLPVTLDGPLPTIAVCLSPVAFARGKDGALATMRHEMKHAAHFQAMIDRLEQWRKEVTGAGATPRLGEAAARARFDKWIDARRDLDKVERALTLDERAGGKAATELLAYVEGFVNSFHFLGEEPAIRHGVKLPPAIYQLYRAGKEFAGVKEAAVQTAALERLREYYTGILDDAQRALLRRWLWFLVENASAPAWLPQGAPTDDRLAAKRLHSDLPPALPFLKRVLTLVREVEFARPAVKAAFDKGEGIYARTGPNAVKVDKPGVSLGKPVKVPGGEVELRRDAEYAFQGAKKGVSLTYRGAQLAQTRWMQFIAREIVAERKDPRAPGGVRREWLKDDVWPDSGKPKAPTDPAYAFSDDPERGPPVWKVDGGTRNFYERETSANRTADAVTLFDEPNNWDRMVWRPFKGGADDPVRVTSKAQLAVYLLRGMEVLFRAELELSWESTAANVISPMKVRLKSAAPHDRIDPAQRAKLAVAAPEIAYL